uniref:Bidirectional sugar transporter SWEET n=1 Tax=Chromera velia CCMP2878 TaxID=1169474 RepID=A0A0G4GG14_9ALVE|eukprot:Cvel_21719.t1-p1 / transcript=Cvel_21719.t1 / gene=Cvel_21719 / organism=Chromera_velia_CCMP2878 / gene_product=Bidirectional sugar transporter SWEET2a, putative / transcript_product=Bidirectional sugar transporter SWEET2a, putative / location=Cvel_scaffold2061:11377-12330(-) / protein_length=318 / sequence_SO=supercontig / SO=protein_coding / is_pseudo=false
MDSDSFAPWGSTVSFASWWDSEFQFPDLSKTVVPALGVILALWLDGHALPDFVKLHKWERELGSDAEPELKIPVAPYAHLWATCVAWVVYSCSVADVFLFLASVPGTLFCVFYIVTGSSVCSKAERLEVVATLVVLLGVFSILGIVGAVQKFSVATFQMVWGWTANISLALFYLSPLKEMWEVVASRDASGIYFLLALAEGTYGAAWMVYGLAIGDRFVWVPNSAGAVIGFLQLLLAFVFRKGSTEPGNSDSSSVGPALVDASGGFAPGSSTERGSNGVQRDGAGEMAPSRQLQTTASDRNAGTETEREMLLCRQAEV